MLKQLSVVLFVMFPIVSWTQQSEVVDNASLCGVGTVWNDELQRCVVAIPTDNDFDGCVSASDVLNLLSTFGTCPDIPTSSGVEIWSCGDSIEHYGRSYATVELANRCWFAENLGYLPFVNMSFMGSEDEFGAPRAYVLGYNGIDQVEAVATDEYQKFGVLYNWWAVQQLNLCPSGWQVSSDSDWMDLELFLGMPESELSQTGGRTGGGVGTKLKRQIGTHPNWVGEDAVGFGGLPGQVRGVDGFVVPDHGYWWTSTPSESGSSGWRRYVFGSFSGVNRGLTEHYTAYSVRCVEDTLSPSLLGCTKPAYLEYSSDAVVDDGSCATLAVFGCTDSDYAEFMPEANLDDGTCEHALSEDCVDPVVYQGVSYDVAQVGGQCWFKKNLRARNYANGDSLGTFASFETWSVSDSGMYAVYQFDEGQACADVPWLGMDSCDSEEIQATLGLLYNFKAVVDERGLCPVGWHAPSHGEWQELEDVVGALGFEEHESIAIRSDSLWLEIDLPNDYPAALWFIGLGGLDLIGLGFGPTGELDAGCWDSDGFFGDVGGVGQYWLSSPSGSWCGSGPSGWAVSMSGNSPSIGLGTWPSKHGKAVRCMKSLVAPQ